MPKLEMEHSTYAFVSGFDPEAGNRVIPHRASDSTFLMQADDLRPTQWRVVAKGEKRNPSRQAPAGSLVSSAKDMAAFLTAHRDGRFGADFPPRNPPPQAWGSLGFSGA